jgi:hypothetical protein
MPRAAASGCTHFNELTAAQMFKHAVRFAAEARNLKSEYLRAAYHRLALQYAKLADERETEEKLATRQWKAWREGVTYKTSRTSG